MTANKHHKFGAKIAIGHMMGILGKQLIMLMENISLKIVPTFQRLLSSKYQNGEVVENTEPDQC